MFQLAQAYFGTVMSAPHVNTNAISQNPQLNSELQDQSHDPDLVDQVQPFPNLFADHLNRFLYQDLESDLHFADMAYVYVHYAEWFSLLLLSMVLKMRSRSLAVELKMCDSR